MITTLRSLENLTLAKCVLVFVKAFIETFAQLFKNIIFFTELAEELSAGDVQRLYGTKKLQKNAGTADGRSTPPSHLESSSPSRGGSDEEAASPRKSSRTNPFAKSENTIERSPDLVFRGKRRIKLKCLVGFRRTVIDENVVEKSKYFNSDRATDEAEENITIDCPRIVELPRLNEPEESLGNKTVGPAVRNRVKNTIIPETLTNDEYSRNVIIPETQLSDEASSSSGVFSSQTSSEQDCDTDLSFEKKSLGIRSTLDKKLETLRNDNHFTALDRLLDSKCDIASSDSNSQPRITALDEEEEEDDERDYSSSKDNVESLRSNLFKWANPKFSSGSQSSAKPTARSAPPRQKPIAAKTRTTRRTQTQKKPATAESQQSLLNMFGFQQK